ARQAGAKRSSARQTPPRSLAASAPPAPATSARPHTEMSKPLPASPKQSTSSPDVLAQKVIEPVGVTETPIAAPAPPLDAVPPSASLTAATGILDDLTRGPFAPAEAPVLWTVFAWVRRQGGATARLVAPAAVSVSP